jgi:hypothetical protein
MTDARNVKATHRILQFGFGFVVVYKVNSDFAAIVVGRRVYCSDPELRMQGLLESREDGFRLFADVRIVDQALGLVRGEVSSSGDTLLELPPFLPAGLTHRFTRTASVRAARIIHPSSSDGQVVRGEERQAQSDEPEWADSRHLVLLSKPPGTQSGRAPRGLSKE